MSKRSMTLFGRSALAPDSDDQDVYDNVQAGMKDLDPEPPLASPGGRLSSFIETSTAPAYETYTPEQTITLPTAGSASARTSSSSSSVADENPYYLPPRSDEEEWGDGEDSGSSSAPEDAYDRLGFDRTKESSHSRRARPVPRTSADEPPPVPQRMSTASSLSATSSARSSTARESGGESELYESLGMVQQSPAAAAAADDDDDEGRTTFDDDDDEDDYDDAFNSDAPPPVPGTRAAAASSSTTTNSSNLYDYAPLPEAPDATPNPNEAPAPPTRRSILPPSATIPDYETVAEARQNAGEAPPPVPRRGGDAAQDEVPPLPSSSRRGQYAKNGARASGIYDPVADASSSSRDAPPPKPPMPKSTTPLRKPDNSPDEHSAFYQPGGTPLPISAPSGGYGIFQARRRPNLNTPPAASSPANHKYTDLYDPDTPNTMVAPGSRLSTTSYAYSESCEVIYEQLDPASRRNSMKPGASQAPSADMTTLLEERAALHLKLHDFDASKNGEMGAGAGSNDIEAAVHAYKMKKGGSAAASAMQQEEDIYLVNQSGQANFDTAVYATFKPVPEVKKERSSMQRREPEPGRMLPWSTLRLYLSTDDSRMGAVRKMFMDDYLPLIRLFCEEHRLHLSVCAMDFGEDPGSNPRNVHVLRSALTEIERCDLYVSFIGDHYGWSSNDVSGAVFDKNLDDAISESRWAWLGRMRDRSMLEIETRCGSLNTPTLRRSVILEQSESLGTTGNASRRDDAFSAAGDRKQTSAVEKLAALKQLCRETSRGSTATVDHLQFRSTLDGARMLSNALIRFVSEIVPRDHASLNETRLEDDPEWRNLEAFMTSRTQCFVGKRARLDAVMESIERSTGGVVVTSPKGLGKSTLLANLAVHLRESPDRRTVVLYHGVSGPVTGSSLMSMLRRFTLCLQHVLGSDVGEQLTSWRTITRRFAECLRLIAGRRGGPRVYLIVDSLDAIEKVAEAHNVRWLPDPGSWEKATPGASRRLRVIVGLTKGSAFAKQIVRNGWKAHEIPELSMDERRELVAHHLQERERLAFPRNIMRDLVSAPGSGSPLYLRLMIEELCAPLYFERALPEVRDNAPLHDLFASIESRVAVLLHAQDTRHLFFAILGHLEHLHAREAGDSRRGAFATVVRLLVSARYGLVPREIAEISKLPSEVIVPILLSLEPFLMEQGGVLSFWHEQLKAVAMTKYMGGNTETSVAEQMAVTQRTLCSYFQSQLQVMDSRVERNSGGQVTVSRAADELPWLLGQTTGAEGRDTLRSCLSRLRVLKHLRNVSPADLLRCWRACDPEPTTSSVMAMFYRKSLDDARQAKMSPLELAARNADVGRLLVCGGYLNKACFFLDRSLAILTSELGQRHPAVGPALEELAFVYWRAGEHLKALPLYERNLEVQIAENGVESIKISKTLNNMAILERNLGNLDRALELHKQSLAIREKTLGRTHWEVATAVSNLATVYKSMGQFNRAIELYQRDLDIGEELCRRARQATPLRVTVTLRNMGECYRCMKDYDSSVRVLKRSLMVQEGILGTRHDAVADTVSELGNVYKQAAMIEPAIKSFKRVVRIKEYLHGAKSLRSAEALWNLGQSYKAGGEWKDAGRMFERVGSIETAYLGGSHPRVATTMMVLAEVLMHSGKGDMAKKLMKRVIEIRVKNVGRHHADTVTAMMNMGNLLRKLGHNDEALATFTDVLKLREVRDGKDSLQASKVRVSIARVQAALGLTKKARDNLKQSLKIQISKLGKEHRDTRETAMYLQAIS